MSDMTDHRADAERLLPESRSEEAAQTHALLAIHDTLAEIRDRLPEPEGVNAVEDEPTDITEEPPVGSQVTDDEGDVWERAEPGWALWWPDRSGWIADLYEGEHDPWSVVRDQPPLRFTTDEDRKRVGLPVEPAPDVDPDEAHRALRVAIINEWAGRPDSHFNLADDAARAAREHIEQEPDEALWEEWERLCRKAEAERDEWKARHAAFRKTVETMRSELIDRYGVIDDILDRDDERGAR